MKTTIEHEIFGRMTHDSGTDKVTVERGDLAEQITWLLKSKNQHLLGTGYWPNDFIRACEVLGIMEWITSVKSDAEPPANGWPE